MLRRVVGIAMVTGLLFSSTSVAIASQDKEFVGELGANGYKSLHLGQSKTDAEATGLVVNHQPTDRCDFYNLPASEGKPNPGGGVFIDPAEGVVFVSGTDKIKTPEGITMGSTLDEARAAYPDMKPDEKFDWLYDTPVPNSTAGQKYRLAFNEDNQISDFGLVAANTGTCIKDN